MLEGFQNAKGSVPVLLLRQLLPNVHAKLLEYCRSIDSAYRQMSVVLLGKGGGGGV